LQALDGVCDVVWWSKSSFRGSDQSISPTPPYLDGEHDIIVSGLASVVFFLLFPSLVTGMFEHHKVNELHVKTNSEVVILFFTQDHQALHGIEWSGLFLLVKKSFTN
jgi:hypothetical protein